MSWIDKIQSGLTITTGDGRSYNPKWMKTNYVRDYNTTEFNFPDVSGTLVKRRSPLGIKYSIEIYFDGEDNLDDAERFRISADDRRPWTIEHPEYGTILVQPSSLTFDTVNYNSTKITGTVTETLNDEGLAVEEVPVDIISGNNNAAFESALLALVQVPGIDPVRMSNVNATVYSSGKLAVSDPLQAEAYFSAFAAAEGSINSALSEPSNAIRQLQNIIQAPMFFSISVRQRINIFSQQLTTLIGSLGSVVSIFDKSLFENNGGMIISAMAVSASTPNSEEDYGNAETVFQVIDILLDSYNLYLANLDALQTDNGGSPESYIPDFGLATQLSDLVNYTVSNLFIIALSAKQLRSFILNGESNIINLAFKFYGFSEDDSNIEQFISQNNLGLNDLLTLPAGKTVIYYV